MTPFLLLRHRSAEPEKTVERDQILRLLTQERRMLQAAIRAMVADPYLAEDVLQEVFVVVMQQHEQFAAGTNFCAWAREIARRVTLAQLRKAGNQPSALDTETLDALEPSFDFSGEIWEDERRALHECIESLPEESRKILDQRYVAESPLAEISKSAGRSVEGIKALLKRLRQTLAECVSAQLRGKRA